MIAIVGSSQENISQRFVRIKSQSICDFKDTIRNESSLSVHVHNVSVEPSLFRRKLSHNRKRQTNLRFTRAKFAYELSNSLSFDSASQKFIQIFRTRRTLKHALSS